MATRAIHTCSLSSTCHDQSNYEIIITTMMANIPFFCSIMEMLAFWWGGGVRFLVRRLMAIITVGVQLKQVISQILTEFLRRKWEFVQACDQIASVICRICKILCNFSSALRFRLHTLSPFAHLPLPPCYQRVKSKFIKTSLQL